MSKIHADWEKELNVYASMLDRLWETGYQPIFISMNTVSPDDDRQASRLVMERAKYGNNAWLVNEGVPPMLAAGINNQCKAALVSRVHGSVNGFISLCPGVMYAFDKKHVGIMEQMVFSNQIFDPDVHSPDDAILKIEEILLQSEGIKDYMQKKLIELQKSARIPLLLLSKL